jgi:multicomponent Na+:H+ antiporter subunit E
MAADTGMQARRSHAGVTIARRATALLALWIALIGPAPADLAVGAFAVAVATWASLALIPPGPAAWRWGAVLAAIPTFLGKSVVASFDVARRALSPRLDVNPGFVTFPTTMPRGDRRNAFTTLTSLMPGAVPCYDAEDGIVYHCLDVGQPVLAGIAEDEARFAGLLAERAP